MSTAINLQESLINFLVHNRVVLNNYYFVYILRPTIYITIINSKVKIMVTLMTRVMKCSKSFRRNY